MRSIIDEQLVLPDAGGHCISSISEVGEGFEGTSSHVDDACHSRQEGRLT